MDCSKYVGNTSSILMGTLNNLVSAGITQLQKMIMSPSSRAVIASVYPELDAALRKRNVQLGDLPGFLDALNDAVSVSGMQRFFTVMDLIFNPRGSPILNTWSQRFIVGMLNGFLSSLKHVRNFSELVNCIKSDMNDLDANPMNSWLFVTAMSDPRIKLLFYTRAQLFRALITYFVLNKL